MHACESLLILACIRSGLNTCQGSPKHWPRPLYFILSPTTLTARDGGRVAFCCTLGWMLSRQRTLHDHSAIASSVVGDVALGAQRLGLALQRGRIHRYEEATSQE